MSAMQASHKVTLFHTQLIFNIKMYSHLFTWVKEGWTCWKCFQNNFLLFKLDHCQVSVNRIFQFFVLSSYIQAVKSLLPLCLISLLKIFQEYCQWNLLLALPPLDSKVFFLTGVWGFFIGAILFFFQIQSWDY